MKLAEDYTSNYLFVNVPTEVNLQVNDKHYWNWMEILLEKYGKNHWCMVVDADEILTFPIEDKINLKNICDYLDTNKYTALKCILLDMYPNKSLNNLNYKQGQNPLNICPFFDKDLVKRVKSFQHDHQLSPDGLVGALTIIHLENQSGSKQTPRLNFID